MRKTVSRPAPGPKWVNYPKWKPALAGPDSLPANGRMRRFADQRSTSVFSDSPTDRGDGFRSLEALFLEALPLRIEHLRRAIQAGDARSVEALAHQLHGAGGGYGFPAISVAAGKLEAAAHRGVQGLAPAMEALEDACRMAEQEAASHRS